MPDGERKPDGIAVDLASDPPATRDSARSEDAIIALRAPLGIDAAHDTVRTFFEAMLAEDISLMSGVVELTAVVQDTRAPGMGPPTTPATHGIATLWRQRFRKREYQRLATHLLYRESDVSTYRGGDLDALPLTVRYLPDIASSGGENTGPTGGRAGPTGGRAGPTGGRDRSTDVVMRVPITTHTLNNERLLGDELVFWLRRDGNKFVIYRMAEEIPL